MSDILSDSNNQLSSSIFVMPDILSDSNNWLFGSIFVMPDILSDSNNQLSGSILSWWIFCLVPEKNIILSLAIRSLTAHLTCLRTVLPYSFSSFLKQVWLQGQGKSWVSLCGVFQVLLYLNLLAVRIEWTCSFGITTKYTVYKIK